MAKRELITAEHAREMLDYDPETGSLMWKPRTPDMFEATPRRSAEHACANWNSAWAGKEAGAKNKFGHIIVTILYQQIMSHRLIWLIMTGEWPKDEVDHENRVPFDNKWLNLREATHSQNGMNKGALSNNRCGLKGASLDKRVGKWRARIKVGDKIIWIGNFATAQEAHEAYKAASEIYHGEYGRAS